MAVLDLLLSRPSLLVWEAMNWGQIGLGKWREVRLGQLRSPSLLLRTSTTVRGKRTQDWASGNSHVEVAQEAGGKPGEKPTWRSREDKLRRSWSVCVKSHWVVGCRAQVPILDYIQNCSRLYSRLF
jgi:hypothetical protein